MPFARTGLIRALDCFLLRGKIGVMKIKVTALLLLVLIVTPLITVSSQQLTKSEIKGIVKLEGWDISRLDEWKADARIPWFNVGEGGAHTLYMMAIIPPEKGVLLVDTAYYITDEQGKRIIHDSPMKARTIRRWDVDGKVFCYTAFGPGVSIQQETNGDILIATLGCVTGFAYYDKDGDGRFETMAHAPSESYNPQIPSWVLK
jgi:hypothetical protein